MFFANLISDVDKCAANVHFVYQQSKQNPALDLNRSRYIHVSTLSLSPSRRPHRHWKIIYRCVAVLCICYSFVLYMFCQRNSVIVTCLEFILTQSISHLKHSFNIYYYYYSIASSGWIGSIRCIYIHIVALVGISYLMVSEWYKQQNSIDRYVCVRDTIFR